VSNSFSEGNYSLAGMSRIAQSGEERVEWGKRRKGFSSFLLRHILGWAMTIRGPIGPGCEGNKRREKSIFSRWVYNKGALVRERISYFPTIRSHTGLHAGFYGKKRARVGKRKKTELHKRSRPRPAGRAEK